LTKPNRRLGHELPKIQGGLSGSQHSFLHLMDPMHPKARNASSFPRHHPMAMSLAPSPAIFHGQD